MSLGEKIINLRKEKGLSQEELAEKLNITRQTISNWETGQTVPDINQSKEICKIFTISLDELVDNKIPTNEEKISNTQKLAGIVIKILKILGIVFIVYIVFCIILIAVSYYAWGRVKEDANYASISIPCHLDDESYDITVYSNKKLDCINCPDTMKKDIEKIVDYNDLDLSADNVKKYFDENQGGCGY